MNIAQRLERLEQNLNPTKPTIRTVVIPNGLSGDECERFIRAEIERIGGPVLIVPDKEPSDPSNE